MDIGVDRNYTWYVDAEAMRALILGKITWKRCFSCKNGLVWVDGEFGEVVSEHVVDPEDSIRFYTDTCEDCCGVGFVFVGITED